MKMSKQKTAVDWLYNRLQTEPYLTLQDFEQAKDLEKQQTIDAYKFDNTSYYPKDEREKAAEQYYSDTYE